MTPEGSDEIDRVFGTFTGAWEHRTLPKLAARLPAWVTPDHLTVLGLLAAALVGVGYALTWWSRWFLLASVAGYWLHWFGDSLDGTLARVRRQERKRYGYFVDKTCDAVALCLMFGGAALSPLADSRCVLLFIIGYLLMNVQAHLAVIALKTFRLGHNRMGPTELRIVFAGMALLMIVWNPVLAAPWGLPLRPFDLLLLVLSASLVATFVRQSIQDTLRLADEDPRPPAPAEK